MNFDLKDIFKEALEEIAKAKSPEDIEKLRIKYLGRKQGILTQISKEIPNLPADKKAGIGTKLKEIRENLELALSSKEHVGRAQEEKIDVTVPGKKPQVGSIHPITQAIGQVKEIFHYLGFSWYEGPEVESDDYNFQKLNIPPDHPSRDVQQTYYISDDLLLRTHTSNMQVRYMEKHKPPIRVLFPGRVFRREMPDASHYPSFHQIEGLLIDEQTSMKELLGSLEFFAKQFFGEGAKIRVYGHHFPYTEPSVEVEVYHPKHGWLEMLGAGMVHPKVLENGGIDPKKYKGWAFGMGADRLAMIKFGIEDIRVLFSNDLRFLNQF